MDYTHPNITIRAEQTSLLQRDSSIKKLFSADPAITAQLFLTLPVIGAGMIFHLSVLQWILVAFVTLLFLLAGIFRTAALHQVKTDKKVTKFEASRIRCMGNAIVTITAGVSFMTYLLVFIPRILQVL